MNSKTKKLVLMAMLAALAYIVMVVGRIPISTVSFLKYDPKDVVITVGGFILGPVSAFIVSLVVSLIEMVTVSETGPIGALMNVLSTCAFACTAAAVYKKNRTLKGAVVGLVSGVILMTGIMLLWNYFITPIYMGYPREAVAAMLVPVFLPFNLIKGGINAAVTMLIYKPVVTALRRLKLVDEPKTAAKKNSRGGIVLISLFVLVSLVLVILIIKGII